MPEYRVRVLTVLLIALLVRSAAADGDGPPQLRAVLRADWTQPSSSTWDGRIRLSEGKLESVRALQLSVGQVDFVASSDDSEIHFRSDGPTAWAGVEFTINAPAQAQVEMELDGQKLTAAFSELLQGVSYHIDSTSQARLRRSVADILPVRVSRTPLIFAPGETIEFEVELRLFANVPTLATRFQVALRRA